MIQDHSKDGHKVVGPKQGIFFFFLLFRATPVAYGSSWAKDGIGAATAGLHHKPTPQLMAVPDD